MAIDWSKVLQPVFTGLGQGIGNSLTQGPQQVGSFLSNPSNLAGLGLIGTGLLQNETPGEVTEARQFLRNRFTSPNALSDQFSGQLQGLSQSFMPLLQQQENDLLNNAQQRIIAGLPQSLGPTIGGSEIASIRENIANTLAPRRQALLGELGLNLLNQQGQAANTILETSQPDQLGQLLALLGMNMLQGQGGQGGFNLGGAQGQSVQGGGLGSVIQQLSSLASSPGGAQAFLSSPQAAQLAAQLGTQLGFDALMAGNGLSGITAMTSRGVPIPIEAINMPGTAGAAQSGAGGFLGGLGNAAAGLGAGLAGNWAGNRLGSAVFGNADEAKMTGNIGGAIGGTIGGIFGGPIGAGLGSAAGSFVGQGVKAENPVTREMMQGALGGGLGSFGGYLAAQGNDVDFARDILLPTALGPVGGAIAGYLRGKEIRKGQNLQADISSQNAQSQMVSNFFLPIVEQSGVNVSAPLSADDARKLLIQADAQGGSTPLFGFSEGRYKGLDAGVADLTGKSIKQITDQLLSTTSAEGDQQGRLAAILGSALLLKVQQQNPSITSLNQVPGVREQFIQQMVSGFGGNQQSDYARYAGLN